MFLSNRFSRMIAVLAPLAASVSPLPAEPFGLRSPDARIEIVGISETGGGEFLVGPPSFQFPTPPPPALADLPPSSTFDMEVSQSATYLHEGRIPIGTSAATDEATVTNDNALDLGTLFPDFRAGDVLRLQSLGTGLGDFVIAFTTHVTVGERARYLFPQPRRTRRARTHPS